MPRKVYNCELPADRLNTKSNRIGPPFTKACPSSDFRNALGHTGLLPGRQKVLAFDDRSVNK